MRVFVIRRKPTPTEVRPIEADVLDGRYINRPGEFLVAFDDRHRPPRWLTDANPQELNVPGEKDRCPHCGELL